MAAPDKGNRIAEWFGYRVYPSVADTADSHSDQTSGRCPFLSESLERNIRCVKSQSAKGVCSVSSSSNGKRQDWLVCPHRTVTSNLLVDSALRLFGIAPPADLYLVPGPTLADANVQQTVREAIAQRRRVIAFLQEKVGGEISVSPSPASPEISFDFTMAELLPGTGTNVDVGKYGILEVQTMDYHGTYKLAVSALQSALNLHEDRFAENVRSNPDWLGRGVEGPNISNVFKRTFYQTMLKFKLSEADDSCAGCVLALPQAVWDSWARHLGKPSLTQQADGTYVLEDTIVRATGRDRKSWIYIFDIDATSETHPNPIIINRRVATDASAMSYHALERAAEAMVADDGPAQKIRHSINARLRKWWTAVAVA
jgi:hypothetical protein